MSHKILIVDDESENLRALERLFRRDYSVLTAESGADEPAVVPPPRDWMRGPPS